MAAASSPARPKVDQLLAAIEQLSPAEQREFHRRYAIRNGRNGSKTATEPELIKAAQARLPVSQERRLRRLISKSEAGKLTAKELAEYQSLAREAEQLDAARADALSELARRWGQSVSAVLETIRVHGAGDGS